MVLKQYNTEMLHSYSTPKTKVKPQKKAAPARIHAIKLLCEFDRTLKPLNLLVQDFLEEEKIAQNEKAFLSELIYGSVRWRIQSDWILGQFLHGKLNEYPIEVQEILRSSIYQLQHLKSIPNYAVLNEAANLARAFREIKFVRLINGVLRNYLRNHNRIRIPNKEENPTQALSIQYAFPLWMVDLFMQQYGIESSENILDSLNQRPQICLRVNELKISIKEYQEKLQNKGVDFEHGYYLKEFLHIKNLHGSVQDLPGYKEGWFSIQDESAGLPSHFLTQRKYKNIIDICAAPGGKITHLAQLTLDRNVLIALDLSFNRLKKVKQNLRRLDIESVRVVQGDGTNLPIKESDAVLIDAPCSGLGVIRKNPDIKIRRTQKDVEKIQELQWLLLKEADKILTKGGCLLYNTCTINKNENELMIERFLREHPEYAIDKINNPKELSGNYFNNIKEISKMDGAFCARLKKG